MNSKQKKYYQWAGRSRRRRRRESHTSQPIPGGKGEEGWDTVVTLCKWTLHDQDATNSGNSSGSTRRGQALNKDTGSFRLSDRKWKDRRQSNLICAWWSWTHSIPFQVRRGTFKKRKHPHEKKNCLHLWRGAEREREMWHLDLQSKLYPFSQFYNCFKSRW